MKIDENVLNNLIKSPKKRLVIYSIYALLGLIIGSAQVALLALDMTQPDFMVAILSVYVYLIVPFGLLAVSNTPNKSKENSLENNTESKASENSSKEVTVTQKDDESSEELINRIDEYSEEVDEKPTITQL